MLAEASEVRIKAIEAQNALLQRAGLLEVLRRAQQSLQELHHLQADHKQQMLSLIQQLKKSLQAKLVTTSLNSFQIDPVIDLVNKAYKQTLAVFDGNETAQHPVAEVIQELKSAIN